MSPSLYQNAYYISLAIGGILYGIVLVLYFQTTQMFFQRGTKPSRAVHFFSVFNTAMLLLVTLFIAIRGVFGQEMWITNADFQGGSTAYLVAHNSVWYRTLGTATSIILQLMSDAFLTYRCFTVYGDILVLIFPCILWIVALVFGVLHLCYTTDPTGGILAGLTTHIGVAYVSISVGLNIVISCMICARIACLENFSHTSRTVKQEEMQRYTGTIPIIVEAALLYAISGVAFVVSYGIRSGVSVIFMTIYIMCSCLSSQMIIIRIADGRAWKRYRSTTSSVIGLHIITSTEVTHTTDSGAKVNLDIQFRSPDPDLS